MRGLKKSNLAGSSTIVLNYTPIPGASQNIRIDDYPLTSAAPFYRLPGNGMKKTVIRHDGTIRDTTWQAGIRSSGGLLHGDGIGN
jgi:hypothetical protein